MTLALLLTAVTGAWSADPKVYTEPVAISSLHVGDILATGFSLTLASESDGIYFDANRSKQNNSPMGSQWYVALNNIKSYGENAAITSTNTSVPSSDLTATPVDASGNDGNAWEVTLVGNTQGTYTIRLSGTYYDPPIEVKPVEGKTNEWTLSMPGSDVVLTPIYAKAAAFATTGTEPEVKTLLPEAAEGVIADTDASLIAEGTGIVAFAGTSTEVTQGTLMYAIGTSATEAPALTAFSATAPTAENYDDAATLYVWYYIQGQDTPDGQEATEENTFDNTEPACLTVQVLTNKFDITFKAANANTIEAGMATVTVDDQPATVTEGKLEGVKMGSEVKMTAKQGYKFRKVEVKKAGPALKTLTVNGVATKSIYYAEGDTWQQAIERPENAGSGWSAQGDYIVNGGYTLLIGSGYVRPGHTIDATKNYSLEAD